MDYDYIKKHYRLIAVDLSGEKELDADLKAIEQIELVEQLKKLDNYGTATDTGSDQLIVCFNNFRKNQRTEVRIFSRKYNGLRWRIMKKQELN